MRTAKRTMTRTGRRGPIRGTLGGLLAGAAALAIAAAPASADHHDANTDNVVRVAKDAGSFRTLLKAAQAAGLVDELTGGGPFTVFAPTDDAFAALPDGTLDSLLEKSNRDRLKDILAYHIVEGELSASDLATRSALTTLNGQRVSIALDNGSLMVDDALVVTPNIAASNGVIHAIETVLIPTSDSIASVAESAGQFGTLIDLAERAGLLDALRSRGPITVLAPTDAAFGALPESTLDALRNDREALREVLLNHVVPGRLYASDLLASGGEAESAAGRPVAVALGNGGLRVGDAMVVGTDIEASNGVIHVIDGVLGTDSVGRLLLGFSFRAAPGSTARAYGLEPGQGLIVAGVTDDLGAAAAGLRAGDIIIRVNNEPATQDAVVRAKESAGAGGEVRLDVVRRLDAAVTLVTD